MDYVVRFRYLGFILDYRLNWKKALRSIEAQGIEVIDSHEASTAFAPLLEGKINLVQFLHSAHDDLRLSNVGFHL